MTAFDPHPSDKSAKTVEMSAQDLLSIGLEQLAYIRPVRMMNRLMYAVHAADGSPISIAEDEATALSVITAQELDPVRLH